MGNFHHGEIFEKVGFFENLIQQPMLVTQREYTNRTKGIMVKILHIFHTDSGPRSRTAGELVDTSHM